MIVQFDSVYAIYSTGKVGNEIRHKGSAGEDNETFSRFVHCRLPKSEIVATFDSYEIWILK